MIQNIILTIILAACTLYAAFSIYKAWSQIRKSNGKIQCAGCPFWEKCEQSKKKNKENCKKVGKKFGGTK